MNSNSDKEIALKYLRGQIEELERERDNLKAKIRKIDSDILSIMGVIQGVFLEIDEIEQEVESHNPEEVLKKPTNVVEMTYIKLPNKEEEYDLSWTQIEKVYWALLNRGEADRNDIIEILKRIDNTLGEDDKKITKFVTNRLWELKDKYKRIEGVKQGQKHIYKPKI